MVFFDPLLPLCRFQAESLFGTLEGLKGAGNALVAVTSPLQYKQSAPSDEVGHADTVMQERDKLVVPEVVDVVGAVAIAAGVVELSYRREVVEEPVRGRRREGAVFGLLYAWVLANAVGHCDGLICCAKERKEVNVGGSS